MKKRLLPIFLTVLLAVALSTVVFATETTPDTSDWTERGASYFTINGYTLSAGNYRLTGDIDTAETIIIEAKATVNLDLNGIHHGCTGRQLRCDYHGNRYCLVWNGHNAESL